MVALKSRGYKERAVLYQFQQVLLRSRAEVMEKVAVKTLHKSKAFKAKEALKAKKQRNAARWKKGKKMDKRKQHAKKFASKD